MSLDKINNIKYTLRCQEKRDKVSRIGAKLAKSAWQWRSQTLPCPDPPNL